jgi:hypothetical protein
MFFKFKKFIFAYIGAITVIIFPMVSLAQVTGVVFNDEINATDNNGDGFTINTSLTVYGSNNGLSGLTIVAVVDTGTIEPPYQAVIPVTQITSVGSEQFNLSFMTPAFPFAPGATYAQFAVVDTASLNSVGLANFNIENSSPYQTFFNTLVGNVVYVGGGSSGNGSPGNGNNDPGGGTPTTTPGGVVPSCEGTVADPCVSATPPIQFSAGATINNPLGAEFNNIDILEFLKRVFENFVKIALPILVLYTIWSGLQFVLARGNEEKISTAKENFLYVIIGAAIVFGSWGIAELLSGTVDQFEAANFVMKLLV